MQQSPLPRLSEMRCKSPSNNPIDESSPTYQSAMIKLYDAAWKFDRGKDGDLLKTLENREFDKTNFKTVLRAGLNCKLSNEELDSLLPLFNNNGFIDGPEFILLFYRLRHDYRSKLLTERVAREAKNKKLLKYHNDKVIEDMESKAVIKLADSFTDEDLTSANDKILEASVKYNRLLPGAVQLDAFECESMKPHVFREQLKSVFNVQLSIPELTAYIRNFNADTGDTSINCCAFLVSFFRMGHSEKEKRMKAFNAKKKRYEEAREKKRQEDIVELDKKNVLKSKTDFTPEEKDNAIVKLKQAAKQYDKSTPGAMSMKSFEEKSMPPHIFKEQLKRVFNLVVTPGELGALVSIFDLNGEGAISCEEFSKVFLNMGFAERDKELKESLQRQKRAEQIRKRKIEKKKAELDSKNLLSVNYSYTEDEFQTAMNKLTDAAWRFDKNMPGAPTLEAFESKDMEAHVFQEQLKRSFNMKVTPPELGAIMHYFDPDNTGMIECSTFLKKFFKTGFDERNRRQQEWRQHQKVINDRTAKQAIEKKMKDDSKLSLNDVPKDFTEEDFHTAFALLTEGAIKYDKNGPGAVPLTAFEVESLPMHVFKEQLKMVFNVKVTIPQLMALMSYFDKENTGSINCEKFLVQFVRTGMEEREKMNLAWKQKKKNKIERDLQRKQAIEMEKAKIAWAEVDFDYSEEDFDSALEKVVLMCYNFDHRQLGPAGLSAFECQSLNPAEFREMLKRTFNLKVTSKELGAAVTYFDTDLKKVVNCSYFLNCLVQMRLRCEEFKGKKGEARKMSLYQAELKESFRHRMSKQPSTEAKPWRQKNVISPSRPTTRGPTKITELLKPLIPIDKYQLRIYTAKKTGKLDLSSHKIWKDNVIFNLIENESGEVGPVVEHKEEGGMDDFMSQAFDEDNNLMSNNEITHTGDIYEDDDGNRSIGSQHDNFSGSFSDIQLRKKKQAELERLKNEEELKKQKPFIETDFKINFIPVEIFKISDLCELWLCNNSINFIPSQIGDLKYLTVLSLTNNKIENLPPEICLLEHLESIYLKGNSLDKLPNLFGKLRNLKHLDISKNQYLEFPEVLTSLPRVITVDISFNKLTTLPKTLILMKGLLYFNVSNNNIINPPLVLKKTPWIDIIGCPIPTSNSSCHEFSITATEEDELLGLLKTRANNKITGKLRRKKKKSNYT